MKEEIIKYEFIASSKVLRHVINIPAADILATLIYKQQYWESEERLIEYKGDKGFYISNADIMEETCFKIHTIKRCLKILKDEGLIISKQRGLGKPNFYKLDLDKIDEYIEDNKDAYDAWRLKVREENIAVMPVNSKKELKQLSRSNSGNFQEVTQTTTTKNKISKNKTTNNITNHINVDDDFDYVDELEELISDLQSADYDDNEDEKNDIYNYLKNLIPQFKDYNPSEKDFELISELADGSFDSSMLAYKICTNCRAILAGSKEPRFGYLFVGIKEIMINTISKHG